jgi:hypothetical protein
MQSRKVCSLVVLLLSVAACAHQNDGNDEFDNAGDDPPSSGGTSSVTPPKGGTASSVSHAGSSSSTSHGGTSGTALPPAGSIGGKGGKGGASSGGASSAGANSGGSGGGAATVNNPIPGVSMRFKATGTGSTVDYLEGELTFVNDSEQPFSLADLKARYYMTDEVTSPAFMQNWAHMGPDNNQMQVSCMGDVVALPKAVAGADSYIEFSCTGGGGDLLGGEKIVISWKLGTPQNGKFLQDDDYSYSTSADDNNKIVLLQNDTIIWGVAP